MEETHDPLTSPRDYTALTSRDGALSIMEDGSSGIEEARTDAGALGSPERGMRTVFAEEQPLLHEEEGLAAAASPSSSPARPPPPLPSAPPRSPPPLLRALVYTTAALLVLALMGLAVYTSKDPPPRDGAAPPSSTDPALYQAAHESKSTKPLTTKAPTSAPTKAPTKAPTAAPTASTLNLWAQFPQGMDDETAGVQALLYANQNPANCSSARYLLWANNNYGMGSDLHTMGWALGVAFAQKRVLIYDTDRPWVYTDRRGCPPNSETPDCFFTPLTRCQGSLSRAEIASSVTYQPWIRPRDAKQAAALKGDRVVSLAYHRGAAVQFYVPPPWGKKSRKHEDVWWWRTQTTRYLVRPNSGQIEWTANYFRDNLLRINADGSRDTSFNAATHAPPEEAICIHVRHGDKAIEMTLHPWEDYMSAAQELVTKQGATPNIFLTTDDGGVIDKVEGGALAREQGWNFTYYYAQYERHNEKSPIATAKSLGQAYFGRVSVANLVLGAHPSCRWFVQTTGSNWNRLINEIRQTDGVRKEAAWVDLQPGHWRRKRSMRRRASRQ